MVTKMVSRYSLEKIEIYFPLAIFRFLVLLSSNLYQYIIATWYIHQMMYVIFLALNFDHAYSFWKTVLSHFCLL